MRRFQKALALTALLLAAQAQAKEQKIEVTSDPPGALVVVDHLVRGKTPLVLSELEPGKHHLRVSHGSEFRPYQMELQVKEGQSEQCHVLLNPRPQTSLKHGLRLFKEGRFDLAEEHLLRALEGTPRQPQAYYWLGLIERDRGQERKALEFFRQYAQYYPGEPQVHLELAQLHRRSGNLAGALTSYKLALLESGHFDGILESVGSATWEKIKAAGEPSLPAEQLQLAYLYEQKGRIPQALHWIQAAADGTFPKQRKMPVR